jgi:two-component system sensor histidine kinase KdpD
VNLLENVARHTPPGTHTTIVGLVDDEFIRVLVDDDGPGFPPGDPEQLFAKFHRGRDEGHTGGAGLGLSICRAIVNAHGGAIHALQRPGGGARFSFTLPIS